MDKKNNVDERPTPLLYTVICASSFSTETLHMALTREKLLTRDSEGNHLLQRRMLEEKCDANLAALLEEAKALLTPDEWTAFINHQNQYGETLLSLAALSHDFGSDKADPFIDTLLSQPTLDLIADGADGANVFFFACHHGRMLLVKQIADIYQTEGVALTKIANIEHKCMLYPDDPTCDIPITPLQVACYKGYEDIAEFLVDIAEIDINARRYNGATALLYACQGNYTAIVKKLLQQPNIDAAITRYDGMTPLIMATLMQMPEDIIETLTEKSQAVIDQRFEGCTAAEIARYAIPLAKACMDGHLPDVNSMLENITHYARTDATASDVFARVSAIVNYPLQYCDEDQTLSKLTPLHLACQHGHTGIALQLLGHQADPNIQDLDGSTALLFALEEGHRVLAETLIAHPKTDLTLSRTGEKHTTPLIAAVQSMQISVKSFNTLAHANKSNINDLNHRHSTALSLAFHYHLTGYIGILLNVRTINPFLDGAKGHLSFHFACQFNRKNMFQYILGNTKDNQRRWTLLNSSMPTWFIDNRQDLDAYTPLEKACVYGHNDIVLALIKQRLTDVNITLMVGNAEGSLLFWAIHRQQGNIVRALLQRKDIDISRKYLGVTPLIFAIDVLAPLDICIQLIELSKSKGLINLTDNQGETALGHAIQIAPRDPNTQEIDPASEPYELIANLKAHGGICHQAQLTAQIDALPMRSPTRSCVDDVDSHVQPVYSLSRIAQDDSLWLQPSSSLGKPNFFTQPASASATPSGLASDNSHKTSVDADTSKRQRTHHS